MPFDRTAVLSRNLSCWLLAHVQVPVNQWPWELLVMLGWLVLFRTLVSLFAWCTDASFRAAVSRPYLRCA